MGQINNNCYNKAEQELVAEETQLLMLLLQLAGHMFVVDKPVLDMWKDMHRKQHPEELMLASVVVHN